jgi:hypothetical protein
MHLQNLTELDLSHNLITSENLASDMFKVKQHVQNEFLCLNSACPFLVFYEEYLIKSLSVDLEDLTVLVTKFAVEPNPEAVSSASHLFFGF